MDKITLQPYQKKAVRVIEKIWKEYDGAILRADEGTGKTIMAAAATKGTKSLFVAPARALKGLRKKLDEYAEHGIKTDIDLVSYHAFADTKKVPDLTKYSYLIFDECHNLRNYSASWTTRFVKQRANGRCFLFLSATPMTRSPKDYAYVLRKTGVFANITMQDFYARYFDAKPSQYGDFLEFGEFQNEACFQAHLDKVSYDIKIEEADPDIPAPVINGYTISGVAKKSKGFEEETEVRLENELNKVKEAAKYIKSDIKNHRVAMVLCRYHETAKALHKILGGTLQIDRKNMQEVMDETENKGGLLITTLGLTDCNFDFNGCDRVYMVGSTHSALMDRQSIRRCYRRGKRTVLEVTYILYAEDEQFMLAVSRAYLEKNLQAHSRMGPSSLKRLEMCPGSYYLPPLDNPHEAAAYFGTKAHEVFERYVIQEDQVPPAAHGRNVIDAIEKARHFKSASVSHGVEDKVHLDNIHKDMFGTADFWCYDDNTLMVLDYKNGVAKVLEKDNLQLLAYAAMVAHTHNIKPFEVHVGILQGGELRMQEYDGSIIQKTEERIKKIIAAIEAAKDEPLKHLNTNPKCDFFCPAKEIHEQRQEVSMSTTEKAPRYKVQGKCFWEESTPKRFAIGVNIGDDPKSALPGEQLKKNLSNEQLALVQAAITKSEGYDNYSAFFGGAAKFIPAKIKNASYKGSEVEVTFTINCTSDRAFFNVQGVEIIHEASEEATSEVKPKADAPSWF